jgi:hypothetical protein
MRLRSDIWVSAYIRRCNGAGGSAVLRKRGAAEAGAIVIRLDDLAGRTAVYGPAPQSMFDERAMDRRFVRLHDEAWIDNAASETRLQRELRFDSDLWIIEVEDRAGRHFLQPEEVADPEPGP